MIVVTMNYIELTFPELPCHFKRDMVGVAWGEAVEPLDQDAVYFLLPWQLSRRVAGKGGDFMLLSQPLAYILDMLLHAANGGIVFWAYLKDSHIICYIICSYCLAISSQSQSFTPLTCLPMTLVINPCQFFTVSGRLI